MKTKIATFLLLVITGIFASGFSNKIPPQKEKNKNKNSEKTTMPVEAKEKSKVDKKEKTKSLSKTDSIAKMLDNEFLILDTIKKVEQLKLKLHKKNAHASYYASRFEGKRTANGKKFSNKGYTAANKKLPFGTKVKVTNEANGKSVIVEITDRGPYAKSREIDLSKKAFMEISSHKNEGVLIVTIEIIED